MASNSTIQGSIDLRIIMTAWCHNSACGHHARLDLVALREKLGPDHGALHDDLAPLLRCSKCGGKKMGLIATHETAERAVPDDTRRQEPTSSYRKAKGE